MAHLLQLEELLRHDTSLVPTAQMMQNGNDAQNLKQPRSSLQKLVFTIKQLLQGRAATNISLLMVRLSLLFLRLLQAQAF